MILFKKCLHLTMLILGRNFYFWVENYGMDDIDDFELNEEVINVGQSHEIGHRLYNNLNERQKEFVDAVIQTLDDQSAGTVHSPGTVQYHLLRCVPSWRYCTTSNDMEVT
jgi:hypothetical protein